MLRVTVSFDVGFCFRIGVMLKIRLGLSLRVRRRSYIIDKFIISVTFWCRFHLRPSVGLKLACDLGLGLGKGYLVVSDEDV